MKIQIKHWINASVLFECEADSIKIAVEIAVGTGANLRGANLTDADLRDANLRGADLRDADLRDANLRGADLRGADLRDANLRGADLRDANLRGANLRDADLRGADLRDEKLTMAPIQVYGMKWDLIITPLNISIGCQTHKAEEWFKLNDENIKEMHSDALPWWKENKKLIKETWEAHKKEAEQSIAKKGSA